MIFMVGNGGEPCGYLVVNSLILIIDVSSLLIMVHNG